MDSFIQCNIVSVVNGKRSKCPHVVPQGIRALRMRSALTHGMYYACRHRRGQPSCPVLSSLSTAL